MGISADAAKLREQILAGKIVRTLLWLAWPVIVANLVQISYNLVDAFWLGKLGKEAFGAPTVSWPLISLFYSFGTGFSSAGMTIVSQYFGAGEYELANRSASQLVSFLALTAIGMSILGLVTAPYIFGLMGIPPDVYPLALSYIRVIFAGIPLVFMGFAFMMIVTSIGDTRTPTKLGVTSALLNIVLDPILIFGLFGFPPLGVVGAALATMISRGVVAAIGTYLLLRGYKGIRVVPRYLRIERWWLRKIVSIGTPISIQSSTNSLGFVVLTGILSRFGSVAIAAYGVGVRIIDILQAFTWGITRATSIMIGQNVGAELYERARSIALKAMLFLTTTLSVGAVAIFLLRPYVISVFVNDPEVIAEGVNFLTFFTPSIPFFGIFFIGGSIAQGSGHTKTFMFITVTRLWLLRIGLSILLALNMGMGTLGIWLAFALSNVGGGCMSLAWILRGGWLRRVVEVPEKRSGLLTRAGEPAGVEAYDEPAAEDGGDAR